MSVPRWLWCLALLLCFVVACADSTPEPDVVPGPGVQEELQAALITAADGDVIT